MDGNVGIIDLLLMHGSMVEFVQVTAVRQGQPRDLLRFAARQA